MHSLYITDVPTTPGNHNAMFQIIQFYMLCRGLKICFQQVTGRHTNMEPWCVCWNTNNCWKTPVPVYLRLVLKLWQNYMSCSNPFVTTHFSKWSTGFHYEYDIYLPYSNTQVIIWCKKWVQQYIQLLEQNTWNIKLLQSNYKISQLCLTMNQGPQMCKMQHW
jgi:hypothetical protein